MHISMLKATAFFYLAGALFYLYFIVTQKERGARLGRKLLLDGAILHPALSPSWLPIHVLLLLVGDAVFAVAFGAGIMCLLQEKQVKRKKMGALFKRLPSLDVLDDVNYRCLTIGLRP